MMTEELRKQIIESVSSFIKVCKEYRQLVNDMESLNIEKMRLERRLKELREKEKLEDTFSQVVYLSKIPSKIDEIKTKLEEVNSNLSRVHTALNQLRNEVLRQAASLRFPIDPEEFKKENNRFKFKYIQGAELRREAIEVLAELLDLKYPLEEEGVKLSESGVDVEAGSYKDALIKIINSIQTLRLRISNMLGFYENIDTICERINRSRRYKVILVELYKAKAPLSLDELSSRIGIDRNTLYQALYDLAFRKAWTPHLVIRLKNGKYCLSTVGKLTMKRYFEKYIVTEGE